MKMKKALILLLLLSVILTGCRIAPPNDDSTKDDPPAPEPYSVENAKLASAWINSNLITSFKDLLSAINAPTLGDTDLSLSLGNGDLDCVYKNDVFYSSLRDNALILDLKGGAYAIAEGGNSEWALSTFESLEKKMGLSDLLDSAEKIQLERVIYSELTFGDDLYYHLDKQLIYDALYNASIASYNEQYPNLSSTLLGAYKLTLQNLLSNVDYDISVSVSKGAVSSLRLSLSLSEKFCELTENDSLKSADITLLTCIPTSAGDVPDMELTADLMLQNGANADLQIKLADGDKDSGKLVDISASINDMPLSEMSADNYITVKAIGDISLNGKLSFTYSPEKLPDITASASLNIDNVNCACFNISGEKLSNAPEDILTPSQLGELLAEATAYANVQIDLTSSNKSDTASDITLTVSAEQSKLTYLGTLEPAAHTSAPQGFSYLKLSVDNAAALEADAKGIIKDLRTKRSDKYHVYLDEDTNLYIIVLGTEFKISAEAPNYEYVTVTYDGNGFVGTAS